MRGRALKKAIASHAASTPAALVDKLRLCVKLAKCSCVAALEYIEQWHSAVKTATFQNDQRDAVAKVVPYAEGNCTF